MEYELILIVSFMAYMFTTFLTARYLDNPSVSIGGKILCVIHVGMSIFLLWNSENISDFDSGNYSLLEWMFTIFIVSTAFVALYVIFFKKSE